MDTTTQEIRELAKSLEALRHDITPLVHVAPKLIEMTDAWDSVLFGKKFLVGLATVFGSIAVIGGGVIWLVEYVRHGGS